MIEQIFIKNYKSIHTAKIPMKNLNVLIGSNGVGKSNFISFFELVIRLFNQQLGGYVLKQGGVDRLLYQGSKHSECIQGMIDFDNTNAFFFNLKPAIGDKVYIEYTGDYFNKNKNKTKQYSESWDKAIWDKDTMESEIVNSLKWRASYLKHFIKGLTVYHFHDTSKTSLMRKPCDINDNESLHHDASNLAAYLYRIQETEPKTFKLIEGVIKSIAPYFKRFKLQPDRIKANSISLEWEEENSDMYLDAYSFSDGTIRFIALATVLLQSTPPSTIIIDEPELGLHPSAITKLSALIKRAAVNTQVIIATQSVNLVNCFDSEDIIVVDREDNQTVFNRFDSDKLSIWLDEYRLGDIWEKNIIGGQP